VPAGVKKQAGTRVGTFLTVPEEVRLSIEEQKLTAKQAEALAILCRSNEPLTIADVCRLARCASGPINALRQRGLVHTLRRRVPSGPIAADPEEAEGPRPRLVLTPEQAGVLDQIGQAVRAKAFSSFLLHGVTGSGKTEVYLCAIEQVVAQGQEAIVLVPEISL